MVLDLQGVSPDREADGTWRPLPVVRQRDAQPQTPCHESQTIFLNVGQRGQRLSYMRLPASWGRIQAGTQILCRHRFHLSRQTRLHLDKNMSLICLSVNHDSENEMRMKGLEERESQHNEINLGTKGHSDTASKQI